MHTIFIHLKMIKMEKPFFINRKELVITFTIDEAKSLVEFGLFILFLAYNFGKAAKK